MSKEKVEYVGKDLEAMDFAVNYHRWILALMKPFLGMHLVEVGAGTGAFSELLLETSPETLSLVEPSAMFETLQTNLAKHDSAAKIALFRTFSPKSPRRLKPNNRLIPLFTSMFWNISKTTEWSWK
jgi:phospholipid N-methyltransferase